MEPKELIGKVRIGVKLFLRRHRFLLMSLAVAAVCLMVGNFLRSSAEQQIAERKTALANVNNDIIQEDIKAQKVVEVVKEPDHGMSTKRWHTDDDRFVAWIDPAVNWDGPEEYEQARAYFVERLGITDPFVMNFLPELQQQQESTMLRYEITSLPADIAMWSNSFTSYVYHVDEQTGTYSYVATMKVSQQDGSIQIGSGMPTVLGTTVIFMYDVTEAGEVENFRHVTVET